MRILILALSVLSVVVHSRKHSNLVESFSIEEIKKVAQHHPYFLLLLGSVTDVMYQKYKASMNSLAVHHATIHSWAFFGHHKAEHEQMPALSEFRIKKLPAMLHFYRGQLTEIGYHFEQARSTSTDITLKTLHGVINFADSADELEEMLQKTEYSIVIPIKTADEKRFDMEDSSKLNAMKKLAEIFFTLPNLEFQLLGINIDSGKEEYVKMLNTKEDEEVDRSLFLYSRHYSKVAILPFEKLESLSMKELKAWIFHNSHSEIASVESAFKKIVSQHNWGMTLFIDSSVTEQDELSLQTVKNFNDAAKNHHQSMMFAICDISIEPKCKKLLELFEIDHIETPFIRILYAMDGKHNSQFRTFKMHQRRLESFLSKGTFKSEQEFLLSVEGIKEFYNEFRNMEIDLETRLQPISTETEEFLKKGAQIGSSPKASGGVKHILELNSRYLREYLDQFKGWERVLLIFDSTINPKAMENYRQMFEKVPPEEKKGRLFASYDLGKNSKHRFQLEKEELPVLRVYRKEDSFRGHFSDRYVADSPLRMLHALVDFSADDLIFDM